MAEAVIVEAVRTPIARGKRIVGELSGFHAAELLGLSLEEVIEMSTWIPARALDQAHRLGTLKPGYVADVVVSNVETGQFEFLDVLHERRNGTEKIIPETVIYSGKIYSGAKFVPTEMTHREDAPPGFIQNET